MSEEEILEDKKWHDEQLETIIKRQKLICVVLRKFQILKSSEVHFLQKDALEIARNMQMNIKN